MAEDRLMKIIKNLYRTQFMVIDAYNHLAEDEALDEEDRDDVRQMMEDHEMHRDRLAKILTDNNIDLPDTTAKMVTWGGDVMAFFKGEDEKYMKMQTNLSLERTLIDLYDIAAVFAQGNDEILSAIDANADDDVEHAEFFKDGALGFAEELYEEKGTAKEGD